MQNALSQSREGVSTSMILPAQHVENKLSHEFAPPGEQIIHTFNARKFKLAIPDRWAETHSVTAESKISRTIVSVNKSPRCTCLTSSVKCARGLCLARPLEANGGNAPK